MNKLCYLSLTIILIPSVTLQSSRGSGRRLSGRLVRTMSDESLHSGKGSYMLDPEIRDALFPEKKTDVHGSREQLRYSRFVYSVTVFFAAP